MQAASRRLGEFLVDRKVLSRDTLEQFLDREAVEGTPLPKLLMSEGLVAEKDLVAAVAAQVAPPATASRAASSSTSFTTSGKPARSRFAAMPEPMLPRPTMPTTGVGALITRLRRRG